jgi:hypothetical protein
MPAVCALPSSVAATPVSQKFPIFRSFSRGAEFLDFAVSRKFNFLECSHSIESEWAANTWMISMDWKTFSLVSGSIFAVVALLHLLRIYMDWPIVIGDWSVPLWVSWVGLVVAGGLAFFGLRLATGEAR